MRAVQIKATDRLEVAEAPDPRLGPGEAVVSLRAAALNHRDVWIKHGQYAAIRLPCLPGSDGAGVVSEVGPGVEPGWKGREVILNPALDWGPNEHAQGPDFTILGMPRAGTMAERIAVPVAQLAPKPAHLSWTEAAAVPLAGLTAWRALFARGSYNPDERVLITGIGAGTALFALQFAVAGGSEVWVTSSSREKIDRAVELGAKGGFLYSEANWEKTAAKAGPFPVIIDSAGGEGFEKLIDLAAPGGRIVFFGATRGNPPSLPSRKIFWRQLTLMGTTMGSPTDWAGMIGYIERHRIRPVVSRVFPLEDAPAAFDLMDQGGQFGKIVIEIGAKGSRANT